jgi:O-antigen/teichoic acid export membrane protein
MRNHGFITAIVPVFWAQGLGMAAGLGAHMIMARSMDADGYGVFSFVFSVATVLALFGGFGFPALAVRQIAAFANGKNPPALKGFLKFAGRFVLLFSAVLGSCIFLLLALTPLVQTYSYPAFLFGALCVPPLALLRLHGGILRGFKKGGWSVLYESSLREILLFSALLIFLLLGRPAATGEAGLVLLLVATLSAFTRARLHSAKLVHQDAGSTRAETHPRDWIRMALPMMVASSVYILIHRADIAILGLMADTATVGAYSAASKIALTAGFSLATLNIVFAPRAAALCQAGDFKNLRSLYIRSTLIQAAITGLLGALLIIAGRYILLFFGAAFLPAYPALVILAAGFILNAAWGPAAVLLQMTHFEKTAMGVTIFATLSSIVLCLVLIPIFGMTGAAIASVAGINMLNILCLFFALREKFLSVK